MLRGPELHRRFGLMRPAWYYSTTPRSQYYYYIIIIFGWGRGAAWLARSPVKAEVAGSNPVAPALIMSKKINILILSLTILLILIIASFLFIRQYLSKSIEIKNKNNIELKMPTEPLKPDIKVVSFETEDGIRIVADYYQSPNSKFAGILIHMMPSDRKSFADLAKKLQEAGYSALAIDLRGHGESINSAKGLLNYKNFTDEEHQTSIYDLKAASEFLKKEGFSIENQFLIGASIGANLSLQFLSQNPNIKAVILLSPGINYRGIKIEEFLKKDFGEKILVIIGQKDIQSISSAELFKKNTPSSTIYLLDTKDHGTDLLNNDLIEKIILFLKEKLI